MSDNKNTTQTPDTGHSWDDGALRELLNQPPKWWMIGFWASIAWCVVYFILYPAIPLGSDYKRFARLSRRRLRRCLQLAFSVIVN